jgi:hypothetical protein
MVLAELWEHKVAELWELPEILPYTKGLKKIGPTSYSIFGWLPESDIIVCKSATILLIYIYYIYGTYHKSHRENICIQI